MEVLLRENLAPLDGVGDFDSLDVALYNVFLRALFLMGKAFPLVATLCAPHPLLRGHPQRPDDPSRCGTHHQHERYGQLRPSVPLVSLTPERLRDFGLRFSLPSLAPVACCAPSPRSSRRPMGCGTMPHAPLQPCTRASLRSFRCASGCVLLSHGLSAG